ncbi:type II toxin-antitoxin system VapC family toxin [Conexibacter sp. CPCC 206217]|uniref:type II toxin-antitoxin system VapC family toxin n=1 Tax=Conexibacter sp. CPCC 206217 TaxID=3064574 RepID=UPI0027224D7A|nr:hypothetical protein [Conexibacter sp. CPCC 206217]MDO8210540.1 hypothetical protein [Conexibacter sp. CPCC 206217]
MTALWDTTLASLLHPGSETLEYAIERSAEGLPVRIAAPTILEIAYGYQLQTGRDERYGELLSWFTRLTASETLSIVPVDGRAALVAGRLRGAMPHPPGRRDRRSKTMRQASWLLDVQIAATAFAAGLDVATRNRVDFEAIAAMLTRLFPTAPALAVVDGPL